MPIKTVEGSIIYILGASADRSKWADVTPAAFRGHLSGTSRGFLPASVKKLMKRTGALETQLPTVGSSRSGNPLDSSMKPTKEEQEIEFREEAERLSTIPIEDQKAVLAIYRECSENKKLTLRDREWNRVRVEALERHMQRLNRRKKSG